MSKKLSVSVVSLLACLGFAGQSALAVAKTSATQHLTPSQLTNLQEFKLQPRFSVWGFTGDSTLAEGQFLAPVYGDQSRALYVVAEGDYVKNDSSWLGGAGLGYRQVVNDRIWGGYAIADYVSTPHNGFTVINPGVEMLGNVWDINVNGYIPLDNKKKLGSAGWAGDTFGDHEYVRPTGHDYYDHYLQQYEEPGRGFDFEVARVIPHFEDAKLHLGAYHFDTADSGSVNGIETRLTYTLNKYTGIELEDNYDNVKHNQFIVGIRFTLGDYSKEEKKQYGIATRLMDPIENDHAVLSSSGLVPVKRYVDNGEKLEHDNVWYFKQGGVGLSANGTPTGSGTAEDPFVGFNTQNYGAINPNIGVIDKYPLMYFAPGAYTFSGFSSNGIEDRFNLLNGWGMYGRTADYKEPAIGDARAKFSYGGVDVLGETDPTAPTTFNSIWIENNKGGIEAPSFAMSNAALYVKDSADVILQNARFENSASASISSGEHFYVYSAVVENSTLNFLALLGLSGGGSTEVVASATVDRYDLDRGFGIYAANSTVNFSGGTNKIDASAVGAKVSFGYGIYVDNAKVNFSGDTNNISATGIGLESGYGYGIYASSSTMINFSGGANEIFGSGSNLNQGFGRGYGIYANSSTVTFSGGVNEIFGSGSGLGYGYGIYANSSTINFSGGTNEIFASASDSATGIYAKNVSIINFIGDSLENKIKIYAAGANKKYGIDSDGSSPIQHNGGAISTVEEAETVIPNFILFETSGDGEGESVRWSSYWSLPW